MPRRTARTGIVKQLGKIVTFTEGDRKKIELAYGRELSDNAWKQMLAATALFTMVEPASKTAISNKDLAKKIRKLSAAAKSVRSELYEESWSPLPDRTLKQIFDKYFANPQEPALDNLFLFFAHVLDAVLDIAEFTEEQLDEGYGGFPEGEWWNIWIGKLTEIAKHHGLPYKVRKDVDKRKNDPSPFAALVYEFQKYLPDDSRKSIHSVDAVAQAISRARHSSKQNKFSRLASISVPRCRK
jgi:hypothetical protein